MTRGSSYAARTGHVTNKETQDHQCTQRIGLRNVKTVVSTVRPLIGTVLSCDKIIFPFNYLGLLPCQVFNVIGL